MSLNQQETWEQTEEDLKLFPSSSPPPLLLQISNKINLSLLIFKQQPFVLTDRNRLDTMQGVTSQLIHLVNSKKKKTIKFLFQGRFDFGRMRAMTFGKLITSMAVSDQYLRLYF